jgi:glycosyltransferase involved in cell wall biosynthesis
MRKSERKKALIYVCGGRSFRTATLGRKIFSVVRVWKDMDYVVKHICGGDVAGGESETINPSYGAVEYHGKWYRKLAFFNFFVHSISELRDIVHDAKMRKLIEHEYTNFSVPLIWERSCRLHAAGLSVAKKFGVIYVLEWKDNLIPYKYSLFKWYAKRVEDNKVKEADYIVVESKVLKEQLIEEYLLQDEEKIIVANNAVDVDEFQSTNSARSVIRKKYGMQESEFVIGYVGSYAFYHDTLRILKAAKICSNPKIRFLMVGNGKDYAAFKSSLEASDLDKTRFIFEHPVDKHLVPEILSGVDAAILPGSTNIICPIKVQEYMSMGLPTLVPDYECNREVIENCKNGVLFKPGDEKSLSAAIIMLFENPDKRSAMGLEARKTVVKKYSWKATWGAALKRALAE